MEHDRLIQMHEDCVEMAPDFRLSSKPMAGRWRLKWEARVDDLQYGSAVDLNLFGDQSLLGGFAMLLEQAQRSLHEVTGKSTDPRFEAEAG